MGRTTSAGSGYWEQEEGTPPVEAVRSSDEAGRRGTGKGQPGDPELTQADLETGGTGKHDRMLDRGDPGSGLERQPFVDPSLASHRRDKGFS